MFRFLDYIFCRTCRLFRTLGFGVQSPFAYHFIRKVIKGNDCISIRILEKKDDMEIVSKQVKILANFYYRFSRFLHVSVWYLSPNLFPIYSQFIKEGYPHTQVKCLSSSLTTFSVAHISDKDDYLKACDRLLEIANSHSVLIFEGIHKDIDVFLFWKRLVNDSRTFVSFDLYYCGVIFFDKKMYKRNYKVNL